MSITEPNKPRLNILLFRLLEHKVLFYHFNSDGLPSNIDTLRMEVSILYFHRLMVKYSLMYFCPLS